MATKVTNIKPRLQKHFNFIHDTMVASEESGDRTILSSYIARRAAMTGCSVGVAASEIQSELVTIGIVHNELEDAQTVVFSADQADVFMKSNYKDSLEYKLPFPATLLQFTKPLNIRVHVNRNARLSDEKIVAILLMQQEVTDEFLKRAQDATRDRLSLLRAPDRINGDFVNTAILIYDDMEVFRIGWGSGSQEETLTESLWDDDFKDPQNEYAQEMREWMRNFRKLAIACIGYINCENVYLRKEETKASVNRKRIKKGRLPFEPYYVCRIRGVNYESESTGTGTTHGHRYDVRGHFRRLQNGRTTWVRPHQRGIEHELYIPKTYVVDKQPA